MSGPDDSGSGDTPTGDFKLPLADDGLRLVSPRFKLHLHWDTPRLEWRAALASPVRDEPAFLKLDDPLAAVEAFERYILDGSLLFSMRRPNFDLVDKAFLDAPLAPPTLLPSLAELRAWEDAAFYCRLGRSAPLFGAPAAGPFLSPPVIGPPPPSPFYKLPDPTALRGDPAAPRAGAVGDILKALHGLPIVQRNLNKVGDEALRQTRLLKAEWDQSPWLDRIFGVAIAAPLAASVVGAVLAPNESRHFAFGLLKGADVPVPFVPGLSLHIDDFGKADPILLAKPSDPRQPQSLQFGLKLDVLAAIPFLAKRL